MQEDKQIVRVPQQRPECGVSNLGEGSELQVKHLYAIASSGHAVTTRAGTTLKAPSWTHHTKPQVGFAEEKRLAVQRSGEALQGRACREQASQAGERLCQARGSL